MPRSRRGGLRRHQTLRMISLQVNGKKVELDQPTSLLDYLERLGVNPRPAAVLDAPACTSRAISAGSSDSGSSVVMMKKSENSAAARPMPGRSWSERAVEPKTTIKRPCVNGRNSASALASEPAACAKSM